MRNPFRCCCSTEEILFDSLKQILTNQEKLLADFSNFNTSISGLSTTLTQLAADVQKLIADFASKGTDQGLVDAATATVTQLQAAASSLDSSVVAADPAS